MTKKIDNGVFYVAISLVAIFAVGTIALAYAITSNINVEGDYNNYEATQESAEVNLGAFPGPDVYSDVNVHGKLVDGGKIQNASTTLTTNITLTAAQVCEGSIITVNSAATTATVSAAALTVTLPATSTLWTTCLKEEGAHVSFFFANLSPTAASTTVITAGTGMDLLEPDDRDAFDVAIAGGARAKIDIYRQTAFESNLDAYVTVIDFSAAD